MDVFKPLNYVNYIKAEKTLNDLYGWEKFQHKHHESRFYWMPKKFGYEKRRV